MQCYKYTAGLGPVFLIFLGGGNIWCIVTSLFMKVGCSLPLLVAHSSTHPYYDLLVQLTFEKSHLLPQKFLQPFTWFSPSPLQTESFWYGLSLGLPELKEVFQMKVSHELMGWYDDLEIFFHSLAQYFTYFLNFFFFSLRARSDAVLLVGVLIKYRSDLIIPTDVQSYRCACPLHGQ